jgi:probable DNA metabolism protein
MICYLYDGTFAGLLTAIHQALINGENVEQIASAVKFQPDLFTEPKLINTDMNVTNSFIQNFRDKKSQPVLWDIYFCFLSEEAGIESLIFSYVQKVLQHRNYRFEMNYADPTVWRIRKIGSRVSYEIHRLHGFVRFRKMRDGIYYAPVEPDYNIVELLAPHFTARFADQQWLIHDLRRGKGIFYNSMKCTPVRLTEVNPEAFLRCDLNTSGLNPETVLGIDEPELQNLWNNYYQAITISERRNKKLQRRHMPQRYWKHLIESVED